MTIVREWVPATEGRYVEHEYTDEEIEDLFQPESGCLVMALLRRAQEAERRVDELERRQPTAEQAAAEWESMTAEQAAAEWESMNHAERMAEIADVNECHRKAFVR